MLKRNMIQKIGWFIVLSIMTLSLATTAPSVHETAAAQVQTDWGKIPLYFIANRGQIDNQVSYYVNGRDKTLYFTSQGLTFALHSSKTFQTPPRIRRGGVGEISRHWVVKLDFVGANPVTPKGKGQTQAIISYFKGPQNEWRTGLPTYSSIVYSDLWQGINLTNSGTTNRLKYEFIIQPGADPARIRLAYRGAAVRLDQTGRLVVRTPAGSFQDDAPIAYQKVDGQRLPVSVAYSMENSGEYGFRLGRYDPSLPLVIDPAVLMYCGYIGGSELDVGINLALDAAGNAYITGTTYSPAATFPVKVGPDTTYNGGVYDAFVAKVKADGTGLVYAGYIGGSDMDEGYGIAVDPAGNAYVTGYTRSSQATFPVAVGPDPTHNGSDDAFVAKVKADGTGLVYAGYIGGDGMDEGYGIAVDTAGNAYITGKTSSDEATFPENIGPGLTFNDVSDVFVAKVKANGTGLVYAGYIGGEGEDRGSGIAVNSSGNAFITGYTESTEDTFPTIVGPDLFYNGGLYDAFVVKVKADGTGLVYSGYIGGDNIDVGNGIAVDATGKAYITGATGSTQATFPVAVGPDLTFNSGANDAFVAEVSADGTGLVYCGYIGGSGDDNSGGIAVDSAGNAYVTGFTSSTQATFPERVGPDLTYNGGTYDGFVAKVKANGAALEYAGYIGGNNADSGSAIRVDTSGNAYVTGQTNSTEGTFPETVGPNLTCNGGLYDAFVAKVSYINLSNLLYLPQLIK